MTKNTTARVLVEEESNTALDEVHTQIQITTDALDCTAQGELSKKSVHEMEKMIAKLSRDLEKAKLMLQT